MAPRSKCIARLTRIAVSVAVLSATSAHASYTVIDDDLLPTAVVDARQAPPTSAEQYEIPFARKATALGPLGRRAVDQLITSSQGASFKIIARPDATPAANVYAGDDAGILPLANARSTSLRQYLLRKGISASSITEAPDNSPNPQTNGSIYPSYIVITRNTARSTAATPVTQAASWSPPSVTPPSVNSSAVTASTPLAADRERLIQFINQSVQAGTMDASVALTLMGRMLSDQSGYNNKTPTPVAAPAQPQAIAPRNAPPIASPTLFVVTPALARKDKWELNKTMTLRDNLSAWSKQAGWNPSQWEAANYFQVLSSTTLEGEFPEVLRQIAESTGLNICARKAQKYVRVTDAGIPCDKDK